MIVGLLAERGPSATILDVGCGDGVLYQRFRPIGCERDVGIDMSDVAVSMAAEGARPEAEFVAGDAAVYQPESTFDAIVFNEVLYYFPDPPGSWPAMLPRLSRPAAC